ncbi:MAG: hypothetical protein K8R59_08150 [Thermoanaerobaculales bacterium]|nr:hypothetical protein [Thermoanaerobaculales bacterium]
MLNVARLLLVASILIPPMSSSATEGPAAKASKGPTTLLSPGDLLYLGAFAGPESVIPPDYDEWAYGGHALTFNPEGDPSGPADGFPGALFIAGNAQQDTVGEINIPPPIVTDDFNELTRAGILQPVIDLTDGLLTATCVACSTCDCDNWDMGGLQYLENIDRVAWTIYDWYNAGAEDLESLGWTDRDMSSASGVWHIGQRPNDLPDPFHNGKTSDYLFTAPATFATQYLGNRRLLSGYHRESGALGGSQGPTLYAMAPWLEGNPPVPGIDLDAIPLFFYRWFIECTDNQFDFCDFDGYRVDDQWGGGVWIDAGDAMAILLFGLKGLGDNCYGDPGVECPTPACEPGRGYHSDPYEPQILFYDPSQVIEIVQGSRDPWDIQPYLVYSPELEVFDPDCGVLSAVAFDREHGLIYVAEQAAGEWGDTAIHVWQVVATLFADGFESGNLDRWSGVVPGGAEKQKAPCN